MVRLNQGREWNKNVRLPEGKTKIDISTPAGAAMAGTIIKVLKNCTDVEDIGNAMTLYNSIETTNSADNKPCVIGYDESYELTDGQNTTIVSDASAMNGLLANGWKLVKTHQKEIYG